uniref:Arginine kinase n=1 Tax=Suberites domuncula TaxID=55567 RepID=Q4W3A2_SUBDO|nr:arginine kinase [Suberites domuncula]
MSAASPDPYFDLILDEDLKKNQWPQKLTAYQKEGGNMSLMCQTMTREMFEKLKGLKTSSGGWTIARAMNTGTLYPTSFVGCHAGDLESYSLYKDLFHPVIEAYHKGYKMDGSMKHVTDMDVKKITEDLAPSTKSKIISTRIRVARNLSFFPLNPGGSRATREKIAEHMDKVFAKLPDDLKGDFFRHTTMSDQQRQQLIDDHFLFRGKDKMQAASGYHQDWPHGRGIFVSKDKKFIVWVNEGDHLRIISMEQGGDVRSVFSRLSRGIEAIEKGLKKCRTHGRLHDPYSWCHHLCPSNLGTAMRGSVHIRVPKLIANWGFEKLDSLARSKNCQARGSSGEHSEVKDRIDVSNWRRLGFSESSLVQDMIRFANSISEEEDKLK